MSSFIPSGIITLSVMLWAMKMETPAFIENIRLTIWVFCGFSILLFIANPHKITDMLYILDNDNRKIIVISFILSPVFIIPIYKFSKGEPFSDSFDFELLFEAIGDILSWIMENLAAVLFVIIPLFIILNDNGAINDLLNILLFFTFIIFFGIIF